MSSVKYLKWNEIFHMALCSLMKNTVMNTIVFSEKNPAVTTHKNFLGYFASPSLFSLVF